MKRQKKLEPEWWRQSAFQWEQSTPPASIEAPAISQEAERYRATDDDLPALFFVEQEGNGPSVADS
jgi:hypothetical protein